MTASSPRSPRQEATPFVSELELESAILKGVASHRPVGRHKHILMIALQADVHEQTGIWVTVDKLWDHLVALYDLEALDGMSSSTPSLPPSPDPLSPIAHPRRRRPRSGSISSLSSPSPPPSRSAAIIDSAHFARNFEIPLGRSMSADGPGPSGSASGSGNGHGNGNSNGNGANGGGPSWPPPDDSDDEWNWSTLVYARAAGKAEDAAWDAGVKAQLAQDDGAAKSGSVDKGAPPRGKAPRRSTTGRRTSGGGRGPPSSSVDRDTSPLSTASERRGGRKRGKRTRESVDESEDEKPAPRRARRR